MGQNDGKQNESGIAGDFAASPIDPTLGRVPRSGAMFRRLAARRNPSLGRAELQQVPPVPCSSVIGVR